MGSAGWQLSARRSGALLTVASPNAISAFKAMRAVRYGSKAWWQAHHALHDALQLPPWVFLDGSEEKPIYPLNAGSETTGEIWRALEAAIG